MRLVPVKCDANGCRLSASFYYNVLCDGHIKRCKPQLVKGVLKCIRIVRGANGKEPRWDLGEGVTRDAGASGPRGSGVGEVCVGGAEHSTARCLLS